MADIEELKEQIVSNLNVLSRYYKIYKAECGQRNRPVKASKATDVLASEGIDILVGTIKETDTKYFAGAKRDVFELYASEVEGCLKDIVKACPKDVNEPVYTDENTGMQRMYPQPGNILVKRIRSLVDGGWALVPTK
jgi:hypothetical protein